MTLERSQGWVRLTSGEVLYLSGTPLRVRAVGRESLAATVAEVEALIGLPLLTGPLAEDEAGRLVASVAAERRKGAA